MLNQRIPGKLSALLGAVANAETSRRSFLLGAAAAGSALVVGFRPSSLALASETADEAPINPLSAYVTIDADNAITVHSAHFDMGQGAYHGIATLVKEELGCSWDQMSVVGAAGDVKAYGNIAWGGFAQGTGGSTAMASSWERYRKAGATAREMLKAAAAAEWGVDASDITAENGMLKGPGGQDATFGAMAEKAAALPVPAAVALKPASAWTEIGNEQTLRHDRVAKTNGTQDFTIDVKLARPAHRCADPSAKVRRQGGILRCGRSQGRQGHGRCGRDPARACRRRRAHVGGDQGPRTGDGRMG
jgi:isoquinoline 1-oxidoreductase beta subunit